MKMELAVYTAQEGYSWQPGTAFTADELMQFKKCMGKFPSPDSMDFPFGGIFRIGELVVFYRYHVAKKIDFRGRDALYCILGAVSRAEAEKIDPAVLFSLPEFAQPMKPFPTSAAVPETPSAPAWWLEKLNGEILNVRISGPAEKPKYNFLTTPPGEEKKPILQSATAGMRGASPSANVETQKVTEVGQTSAPQVRTEIVRELYYPQWMIWTIATLAVFVFALSILVAVMWWQMKRTAPTPAPTGGTNVVEQAKGPTNAVANAGTNTNKVSATPAPEGPTTKPQADKPQETPTTTSQKPAEKQTPPAPAQAAPQPKTADKPKQPTSAPAQPTKATSADSQPPTAKTAAANKQPKNGAKGEDKAKKGASVQQPPQKAPPTPIKKGPIKNAVK